MKRRKAIEPLAERWPRWFVCCCDKDLVGRAQWSRPIYIQQMPADHNITGTDVTAWLVAGLLLFFCRRVSQGVRRGAQEVVVVAGFYFNFLIGITQKGQWPWAAAIHSLALWWLIPTCIMSLRVSSPLPDHSRCTLGLKKGKKKGGSLLEWKRKLIVKAKKREVLQKLNFINAL